MGRIVVNKHLDNKENITRELFHENNEYAKGEIIIVNDDEPSIYVLDNELNPKAISGGGQGNIDSEVLKELRDEFKAEDTKINNKIEENHKEIQKALSDTKDDILKHTVNGNAIEKNPVLDANNINVGEDYKKTELPDSTTETIQNSETLQIALKKLETMIFINNSSIAASLNDLNRRITNLEKKVNEE